MKEVKFTVPMDMSVSWCWPPHTSPNAVWYTMKYRDSVALDKLCGGSPTHEEKLAKMEACGWQQCKGEGNLINVRSPR